MQGLSTKAISFVVILALAAGLMAAFWDDIDPLARGIGVGLVVASGGLGLAAFRRRGGSTQTADPLTRVLERVVADETRRPWSPTRLAWSPTAERTFLLVPAADYHLAEIVPLAEELEKRGFPTRIAIGESPWERTWPALSAYPGLEVFALPEPEEIVGEVSGVLVMKDTGSLAPFVQRCRELGIFTAGKVEGAQDFWDSDTPEDRRPYRNLDLVLCQGRFDAEALADRETAIVGSTRLERLWWAPPVTVTEPLAVINLNFVYGVRTADRKLWLETAIDGCERAGIPYVISVHPAERTKLDSPRATSISASRLLPHASVLISRFSTIPLEAMARGVPFVYHNPHGETVKTFVDPMGAFEVTKNGAELKAALEGVPRSGIETRRIGTNFMAWHHDTTTSMPSEARGVQEIVPLLCNPPHSGA